MRLTILTICFALAGCAHQSTPTAEAPQPITCQAGPDCDAKWSRAVSMIANNAGWKIQTQTDSLIQTYNSTGGSTRPSYTVTKTAIGNGLYEITLSGGCDNFVCTPTITESRAKFYDFVMAPIDTPAIQAAAQPPQTKKR
jgi:hypothetical protein